MNEEQKKNALAQLKDQESRLGKDKALADAAKSLKVTESPAPAKQAKKQANPFKK